MNGSAKKNAAEFHIYITRIAHTIPNYAKRQQMRWSKRGAHLMLQTRTRALDGTLRAKFEQWYPASLSPSPILSKRPCKWQHKPHTFWCSPFSSHRRLHPSSLRQRCHTTAPPAIVRRRRYP